MNMNKQGKVWGFTQEIFNKHNVSINRISINKNGTCSRHYHNFKYNIFFVESGKILVQEWKKEYDLIDETTLGPGEMCSVPPKNYHKFIALEDSIVYEIYYTELYNDDIIRYDVGHA